MEDIFYRIAGAVEVVSFAIMLYGSVIAMFLFVKNELCRFTGKFRQSALNYIRVDFGYYILLGLEFLIAADIIETILKPTNEELYSLAGIVVIRILLGYFLGKEISELKKERPVPPGRPVLTKHPQTNIENTEQ
jgi:uncharacterized membrane protein